MFAELTLILTSKYVTTESMLVSIRRTDPLYGRVLVYMYSIVYDKIVWNFLTKRAKHDWAPTSGDSVRVDQMGLGRTMFHACVPHLINLLRSAAAKRSQNGTSWDKGKVQEWKCNCKQWGRRADIKEEHRIKGVASCRTGLVSRGSP